MIPVITDDIDFPLKHEEKFKIMGLENLSNPEKN